MACRYVAIFTTRFIVELVVTDQYGLSLRRDTPPIERKRTSISFRDGTSQHQDEIPQGASCVHSQHDPKVFWQYVGQRYGRSRIPGCLRFGDTELADAKMIIEPFPESFSGVYQAGSLFSTSTSSTTDSFKVDMLTTLNHSQVFIRLEVCFPHPHLRRLIHLK
ncbi:hypothetical protein QE152_g6868 [Popillia japonica]|uniref:Uncharacterized protein n=1 Tax=Popillia japonica TaxID=7064 RepID=A0AAW1MGL1_POPJA